ncbi:helix-turn-helix domain-containing protein [Actinoallomurus purpureus]|uniref:helix-turn-helix domain-containing protein n=1 Tax=Actinoallomurus purpureus TaxID=478114 RepID=UPI00209384AF|nr:helix-turn-helix transcriptional regulator [Actinoallomurus purpureus]MCO6009257.1 helix-turn-helix domain-containing protein [Actinoallomurus purpureus]
MTQIMTERKRFGTICEDEMSYTPTIGGRQLARELRRLREEAKMTGEQAARALAWEQSKVSRTENAKMRITAGEVMEICEAYGITGEKRTQLIQLAREARKKGWWHEYGDYVKKGFIDYLAFEAEAATYRGYEAQLVPGLFQTEEYARAIFRTWSSNEEDIERGVEARLARQERLATSTRPLHVWAIVEESALRRIVGSSKIMHEQLGRLVELGRLANVSIQVLPYRAGVHAAIDGPFVLLAFDGYPEVLYIEHLMGCVYLEKPGETARGSVVFDHLRTSALNTGDSAALIEEVRRQVS